MPVALHHTIVPAADAPVSAAFLAALLGLPQPRAAGPFTAVAVNDGLTLDFDDRHGVRPGHYAFLVDDVTFDAVLARLRTAGTIDYGAGPEHGWDRRTNHLGGGRGVYVRDPDGHSYEIFTAGP
ncbi:VOC family protein [Dactylosporangium roseum]|uniref:VOC family protein n=1 Tax=Dactylosporangium roseum TaxID=47989 RepID=A0ABY5YVM2_9ACTN|nr:VOC family protein [Dactylosporangium roseum]UWZ33801.1 VOC family protein [Dactylosporangium roseum]